MNYWQYINRVAPKWLLFALESYILFISATILFPIIFDIQFTLELYIIWFSFITIHLITSISESKNRFILYLSIAILFILSLWYWEKSLLISLLVILVFFWRYFNIEEIFEISHSSFLNRIKVYVVFTGLFFIFTLFVDYQITNSWVVYSYLKILIIYLISGSVLQLNDSVNNKELRRSLFLQTIFLLGGFSIVLIIFYLIKDYIYMLLSFIKKGITFIQISIGQLLEGLLNDILINREQDAQSNNDKDIINQQEAPLFQVPDDYTYSNKFWEYFEIRLLLLAILIIILLIFHLVRRANLLKTNFPLKTSTTYIENIVNANSTNKKIKRLISANLYRKNYQKLLLWLIKVKVIKLNKSNTSNEIKNIIVAKYPHLATEIERITLAYQQARYSNFEPDMSLIEFKNIIRSLKEGING